MADKSLFEKIADNEIPNFKVWEDDRFMAWLTPFPNTPGFTVVAPKKNPGDYVFDLDDELYAALMNACRKVAKLLEKGLGVERVALVYEGTGVAHVHAKLIPLHGELGNETNVWSHHQEFYPEYIGYFTTAEGPRMSDGELQEIQAKIKKASA
ncbi:MAG TPA: HIT family protein [Candidatus Saccharimonadales bacterium]